MPRVLCVMLLIALLFGSCYSQNCACQEKALECEQPHYQTRPSSCKEIKQYDPFSQSGYYIVMKSNGDLVKVYCYMDELCGYVGGWKRVAFLDMTDAGQQCPPGLRLYSANGVRACGRSASSDGSCH